MTSARVVEPIYMNYGNRQLRQVLNSPAAVIHHLTIHTAIDQHQCSMTCPLPLSYSRSHSVIPLWGATIAPCIHEATVATIAPCIHYKRSSWRRTPVKSSNQLAIVAATIACSVYTGRFSRRRSPRPATIALTGCGDDRPVYTSYYNAPQSLVPVAHFDFCPPPGLLTCFKRIVDADAPARTIIVRESFGSTYIGPTACDFNRLIN